LKTKESKNSHEEEEGENEQDEAGIEGQNDDDDDAEENEGRKDEDDDDEEEDEEDDDEEEDEEDDDEEEDEDDEDEEEGKPNLLFESAVLMRMDMIEAGFTPDRDPAGQDPSVMDTAEWKEAWRRHKIKPRSQRRQEEITAREAYMRKVTAKGANPKKPKRNTPPPEPEPSPSASSNSSASSSDSEGSSSSSSRSSASWNKGSDGDDYIPSTPPPEGEGDASTPTVTPTRSQSTLKASQRSKSFKALERAGDEREEGGILHQSEPKTGTLPASARKYAEVVAANNALHDQRIIALVDSGWLPKESVAAINKTKEAGLESTERATAWLRLHSPTALNNLSLGLGRMQQQQKANAAGGGVTPSATLPAAKAAEFGPSVSDLVSKIPALDKVVREIAKFHARSIFGHTSEIRTSVQILVATVDVRPSTMGSSST
jgi:hypothetical protein